MSAAVEAQKSCFHPTSKRETGRCPSAECKFSPPLHPVCQGREPDSRGMVLSHQEKVLSSHPRKNRVLATQRVRLERQGVLSPSLVNVPSWHDEGQDFAPPAI